MAGSGLPESVPGEPKLKASSDLASEILERHFYCSLLVQQVSKASQNSRGQAFAPPNRRIRKEFLPTFNPSQLLDSMFFSIFNASGRGPAHAEHSIGNVTFSIRLILIYYFSS